MLPVPEVVEIGQKNIFLEVIFRAENIPSSRLVAPGSPVAKETVVLRLKKL